MQRCAVALGAVVLLLAWAVPAEGAIHERFSFTEPFTNQPAVICGIAVLQTGSFGATGHVRAGTGKRAGAFFVHSRPSFQATTTNPLTGRSFTVTAGGIFQETKATPLGGSLFEFTSIEAGRTFTLTDAAGNVVLRDRGVIRTRVLFDTGGDDEPGGTVIRVISERASGPHPGFRFDDQGIFCPTVRSLLL
jgi:hypothetical protein